MRYLFLGLLIAALAGPVSATPEMAGETRPSRHIFRQDERQLEVFISPRFSSGMRENLLQWVDFIAAALRQVYGHWPVRRWQISIEPTAASASDPIPWAQVHREDIDRVEFFTTVLASPAELQNAWTSYHELAHLLIPYRGWGDAWFSEGLASYYQNILQARVGLLTEQQMWQKLFDGFERGLAETRFDKQPLRSVSDDLRKNGGFMRVYWSGAWYFLAADTRLRQQSGGKLSLDKALEKLSECCAGLRLSVPEIVARLDLLNEVLVFKDLYDEVSASTSVPPFDAIFASLGIDVIDGEVRLQDTVPGAAMRREISVGALPNPAAAR